MYNGLYEERARGLLVYAEWEGRAAEYPLPLFDTCWSVGGDKEEVDGRLSICFRAEIEEETEREEELSQWNVLIPAMIVNSIRTNKGSF